MIRHNNSIERRNFARVGHYLERQLLFAVAVDKLYSFHFNEIVQ